jgi:hypothetical protein
MASSRFKLFVLIVPAAIALFVTASCGDKGTDPPVNNAPRITSASMVQAVIDSLFTYTATATDPDGDAIEISFDNYPAWMTAVGAVISGTPDTMAADAAFTVMASDGSLSDTLTVLVEVVSSGTLISYSADIQPIFDSNCAGSQCHVPGPTFGLSLGSYAQLMQGGNSGAVVIPGDPDNSVIIRRLEGDIQPQMPFQRQPLPQATIDLIRDWIAAGAHDN